MTSTTTITIAPSAYRTETLYLQSKDYLKTKVKTLIEKLRVSDLLSETYLRKLTIWEYESLPLLQNYIEKKNQASTAQLLCFLLLDVVQAQIAKEDNYDIAEKLWDYISDIKKIIKEVLPPDIDVDYFIHETDELDQERIRMEEDLKTTKIVLMKKLYQLANNANVELQMRFDELKNRISQVNNLQLSMTEENHKKLDDLTQRIESVSRNLFQQATEASIVGERMQKEEIHFQNLIKECFEVLLEI